jgi:hypothetical protein
VPKLGERLPDIAKDLRVQGVADVGTAYGDRTDFILD